MDSGTRVRVARESAQAGGEVASDQFRRSLSVTTKDNKTDVVTETDQNAQDAVVEHIREEFPDEPIVGEERGTESAVPDDGTAWLVDPIDGTNNFVRGNRRWTTSVASLVDGEVVAGANIMPAIGDTYVFDGEAVELNGDPIGVSDHTDPERFMVVPTIWWERDRRDEYAAATTAIVDRFGDLRRIGSAQAALAGLASGTVDGVVTNREADPWDVVAGVGMVRAAGGTVTDLNGDPWRYDSHGLVASNGNAHETLLAAARDIEAARTSE